MKNNNAPFDRRLKEILNDSECVFSGSRFDVNKFDLEGHSGKKVQREAVVHPGAVTVLPIIDEETFIIIRNERFAIGETLWELPAGTLEPNEPPQDTAARELIEETGYEAKNIQVLTTFYSSPGFCNEVIYAFCAKDLAYVGQDLDETEKITVEPIAWEQALLMIREGTIRDSKTIATLFFYHSFFR